MAIEIREYLGADMIEHKDQSSIKSKMINLSESHASDMIASNSKMVDIEAIHSVITRNSTLYTNEAMKKATKYWTVPYERPVIMHHNEKDGVIIGRVKHAYYTDKDTRSGTGATRFITNIASKEGIEGINNGTLKTVSIGVLAYDVRCSICNTNVAEEECEHERGAYYDQELCYWIVNEFEPKEVSFVIVPSDPYAHILKVYDPQSITKKKINTKEEVNDMHDNPWQSLMEQIDDASSIDLNESNKNKEQDKKAEEAKKDEKSEEDEDKKDKKEGEENGVQDKEETKEEEIKNTEESNEKTEEKQEEGENQNDDNNVSTDGDENKEENNEKDPEKDDNKKEDDEENGEQQGQGDNESEVKTPKNIDEDHQKDIDNKKDDIYKVIEKKVTEQEQEIKSLQAEIKTLKSKLASEKSLKESMENELMTYKKENKKKLAENIVKLKESLSLQSEKVEELMESSEDALNMTMKNLKEFKSMMSDVNTIPQVQSPVSISESHDNTIKPQEPNNSKQDDIELTEDLVLDILSKAFSGNTY